MKKVSPMRFFVIYFILSTISNFVHPITPMFLQSIQCPDYMFGAAFSAMAFANFLASPLWGYLGERYGYIRMMSLGYFGYGMGQLLFSMATGSWMVVMARAVGGFFTAGLAVNGLAYLISLTDDGVLRGKYLAIFAAMQSVGGAGGFLIGGLIGDYSMSAVFITQIAGIVLMAAIAFTTLGEVQVFDVSVSQPPLQLRDVNPISSLIRSSKVISLSMGVFLFTVFLSAFATAAHDNSFNYYLRAQLDFPPSGNGMFKAVVGLIAIVANSTINMWLARKVDGRKSLPVVLALCGLSLIAMLSVSGVPAFLATALLYYTFSVIYLPIQQVLAVRNGGNSSTGQMSGLFNAFRSLGMMAGPLFAGFAYGQNPNAPFVGAAVGFLLAAGICLYNARQFAAEEATK